MYLAFLRMIRENQYLPVVPAKMAVRKLVASWVCVLRDAPFGAPQHEEILDRIKKIPHPEEAAEQLSRRTDGTDPADPQFPYSLESGNPGASDGTVAPCSCQSLPLA
jgi:hypothetical protein